MVNDGGSCTVVGSTMVNFVHTRTVRRKYFDTVHMVLYVRVRVLRVRTSSQNVFAPDRVRTAPSFAFRYDICSILSI
jgi:hypothetical protein